MERHVEPGRFFGVGVGPGDPELLTLKAQRILSQVHVVFVPQTGPGEDSFAYSIVKGLLDRSKQKVVPLIFPMTKDEDKLGDAWNSAADQIWRTVKEGRDCALITEGDPFLYSTFIYIYEIVRERHPEVRLEVVPGISSVFAAASRAGQPLGTGGDSVAILSSFSGANKIRETLESFDTVVVTKIDRSFDSLLKVLEESGLAERAIWVKRCTTGQEEIVRDIRQLKGRKLDYFSLLIVRK